MDALQEFNDRQRRDFEVKVAFALEHVPFAASPDEKTLAIFRMLEPGAITVLPAER